MAISNEFNWLVVTTGNKSEMAMGYCTLYGDMCGGFALIKDVPKPQYLIYAAGEMSNPKSSLQKLLTVPLCRATTRSKGYRLTPPTINSTPYLKPMLSKI